MVMVFADVGPDQWEPELDGETRERRQAAAGPVQLRGGGGARRGASEVCDDDIRDRNRKP